MGDLGRYRRLYTRLWAHPAFASLTDGERLTSLYLLTGPQQNRLGFARLSAAAAAEDLHVSVSTFRRRLETVCAAFGWRYDAGARVLLVPSWWRFNQPQNEKHLIGCLSDLADVPDTILLADFARCATALPDHLLDTFRTIAHRRVREGRTDGIDEGMGEGIGYQEQKQKQYQEQDQKLPRAVRASVPGSGGIQNGEGLRESFEAFWQAYPNKVGKDAAWKAWQKRHPNPDLTAQILPALAWQRQQERWLTEGGKYVPNPAKWITEGRWQDEPPTAPRLNDRTLALARAGQEFLKS